MAKVTVEAPRSVVWLTLAVIFADGFVAAVGPAWVIVSVFSVIAVVVERLR
jgi:hypothetical protein